MITARLALDYNREVFALPGRIDESASQGTLQLIREGAVLIRNVDDILSELQWGRSTTKPSPRKPKDLSDHETLVLRQLSGQAISLDELSSRVKLESSLLLSTLSQLEIKGYLLAEPGGYYRKTTS